MLYYHNNPDLILALPEEPASEWQGWWRPNLFLFITVEDSPLYRYNPNIFSEFFLLLIFID